MPAVTDQQILTWLRTSADGVIEIVKNHLHSRSEDGEEITRAEIEAQVESTVNLTLSTNEWHVQKALLEMVNRNYNVEDLYEEYGPDNLQE